MRKAQEQYSKSNRGGAKKAGYKFSFAYCTFFLTLCKILGVLLGARTKKSKAFKQAKKSGAMLVVANHLSAFDFLYFAPPFLGKKLNFVVAQNKMYSTPGFAKLIKSYHAITKRQYFADFQCIKSIKRCLDSGISVLLCPEGKVSADGKTGVITSATAKLIKWLGYPVGVIRMSGAGLVRPKWASSIRLGRVRVECDMLMDAEQAKQLPPDQINALVESALAHNEHLWQTEHKHKYLGARYAEGLHRLLYRCPNCGKEFEMWSKKDEIGCHSCGAKMKYTRGGKLVAINGDCPKRIDLWMDEQRKSVDEQVREPDFCLQHEVCLFIENENSNGYRYIANGLLRMDSEKISFSTQQNERSTEVKSHFRVNAMQLDFGANDKTEQVEECFKNLTFSIKGSDTIANNPGMSIDLYDNEHTYRFMFADEQASTKYVLAVEQLFKQRHAK